MQSSDNISRLKFHGKPSENATFRTTHSYESRVNQAIFIQEEFEVHQSDESDRFISKFVQLGASSTLSLDTDSFDEIDSFRGQASAVVLSNRVNDIRYINKFFRKIREKLEDDGILTGCMETYAARGLAIEGRWGKGLGFILKLWAFIIHRVFPKTPLIKEAYFSVTRGKNRMLSKAEVLGRLVYCGFDILEYKEIEGKIYFAVKKGLPKKMTSKPSYGLIYGMPRVGKNGKMFLVYKFRTMHPYSEFLHDYVLNKNGYSKTGKPANDFRLTPWGRFLRRYWLDELPQLLNILKGEMKLVGIRPVGERYMQDIPQDLVTLRLKHKPGCIPPYVSLNMNSDLHSVQEAERAYLIEKSKRPFTTDIRYFFKAIFVILVRKKRSA